MSQKICSEQGYKSAMIFTFDIEIWFKLPTHPLLKRSVDVKYEPNSA